MKEFLDKTVSLTPTAYKIICDKATEPPHSGEYNTIVRQGTYLCRRCGLALFRADSQFTSGCGWPSFDIALEKTVEESPDADGHRTEILCNRCKAHLGHVFIGEHFTAQNRRYCVNSVSIDFVADDVVLNTEEAILAGGCFWGVDYFLRQLSGVLKVEAGYTGGRSLNPTYEDVCQGDTGHYEAVRVIYDTAKIDYKTVLKRFFEIHDPTQLTGQGPDIGQQYQSAVFYYNEQQKQGAEDLMQQLQQKGFEVATRLINAQPFWPAESYHQDYYSKHNKAPYCHRPVSRFE